jgi:hypothetical protein
MNGRTFSVGRFFEIWGIVTIFSFVFQKAKGIHIVSAEHGVLLAISFAKRSWSIEYNGSLNLI